MRIAAILLDQGSHGTAQGFGAARCDLELQAARRAQHRTAALKDAADKLLANTVIENYRVELLG